MQDIFAGESRSARHGTTVAVLLVAIIAAVVLLLSALR